MIRQVTFGFLISMMSSCWHSGALALSPERQSARMSKIKNGGLDLYGTEPFKQQQFGTAGVKRVKESGSTGGGELNGLSSSWLFYV